MKKLLISFLVFFLLTKVFAQPSIQWQKSLGGSNVDQAYSIQQTTDDGYIVAGLTSSNDSDVTGNHGSNDCWIVKLNSIGSLQWQKCLGGSTYDVAGSIQQTSDEGYIVAGYTNSNNNDVSGNHGNGDCWIVKLDSLGSIQWQNCLGGNGGDGAKSIQQTTDGGYIVAGTTGSNDSNVIGNHGSDDFWIVKLNSFGSIQWQKCLGGSDIDEANSIQQTADWGYIVTGFSRSNNGDVTGNHGIEDFWVVKLDSLGTLQWQKCFGGSSYDRANSIQQTTDGGYIVGGQTFSNDGDVTGNHGSTDNWILKLNSSGSIQWQKCLGGSNSDQQCSLQQTTDGGYIVAGTTDSNDNDVTGNHGLLRDFWVIKLDSLGSILWQKCLGGSGIDVAFSIQQTTDSGYIVAGDAESNDNDVSGNHGRSDYWVVKLSPFGVGVIEINNTLSDLTISPNPITQSTTISFSLLQKENTTLRITDMIGKEIKTIFHSDLEPGKHSFIWDATNNGKHNVENGIYLISISTEHSFVTTRVEVVK